MPEQRLRCLADASILLASSLDIRETLDEYLSSFPPENHRPSEMIGATASGQSISSSTCRRAPSGRT